MRLLPIPRLPGVVFEQEPPPRAAELPPLDIAGFVGFARRGPLDLPVAVEDANAFAAVFGGAVPLARLAGGGRLVGHLPGLAESFFANGGRRCHVVRVAGPAASAASLRLPGIVALKPGGDTARLAMVEASSPGRWGEALRVATRLEALPLPLPATLEPHALAWSPPIPGEGRPEPGDVLRVTMPDGRAWLLSLLGTEAGGARLHGTARRLLSSAGPDHPALPTRLRLLTAEGSRPLAAEARQLDAAAAGWNLLIEGSDAVGVAAGDVLRLAGPGQGQALLFPVAEAVSLPETGSPPVPAARLTAPALLDPAPGGMPPLRPRRVERLRFDLRVIQTEQAAVLLAGLAYDAAGSRFWGDLALVGTSLEGRPAAWSAEALASARGEAESFRAWCGPQHGEGTRLAPPGLAALTGLLAPVAAERRGLQHLPLAVPEVLDDGAAIGPDPGTAADDLDRFDPACFVDRALVPNLADQRPGGALRLAAEERRYARGVPLRALHALLFVDEVAMLAMPDATQPGWAPGPEEPQPPPPPAPPAPERACFAACDPAAEPVPEPAPQPAASPAISDLPLAEAPDAEPAAALLQLHGAMLRFCHARRDAVALLSLPQTAELPFTLAWVAGLRAELARDGFGDGFDVDGLSFGTAWHPWLLPLAATDGAAPAPLPPEGAVAGLIARRERRRGVWVAPANEALAGVVDLAPPFDDDAWAALLAARINLVRRGARDFRPMSAHTLSAERSLLQLSVRRLLILLRRLALIRGQELVFENNTERFREAVRTAFRQVLTGLFERGAFAGRAPEDSFRVLAGPDLNPPAGIDAGRFVTQILVAPSEPAEFLSVRVTRTADGAWQAGGA